MSCIWSSDCDLEGQGWLDDFVFPNDPQSSSGTATVWVVTVPFLVIPVLLGWNISQMKQGGATGRRRTGLAPSPVRNTSQFASNL